MASIDIEQPALPSSTSEDPSAGLWCVAAVIVAPADTEAVGRASAGGTKQFKPGAKVYVIGRVPKTDNEWFAIGHHRKSKQFVKGEVSTALLTQPCLQCVDTPNVVALARKHFAPLGELITKESAVKHLQAIQAF